MIRKQIYLDVSMDRALKEVAKSKGVSQAEVIREGLENYLVQVQQTSQDMDSLFEDMRSTMLRLDTLDRASLYNERLRVAERSAGYWTPEKS